MTYSYDAPGIPYSKGRLTSVSATMTTGAPQVITEISKTSYAAFDAMGRVTASSQQTNGQTYSMSYEYDLAGNLTREIYPTGRVVQHTFDAAGRLHEVIGIKGNAAPLSYATVELYTAHGEVQQLLLGNSLTQRTSFNNRLQPKEIKLGTSANPTSKLSLQYYYGTAANNGNVLRQTITLPDRAQPILQSYEYDALNRLSLARESYNSGATGWQQTFSYDRFGNRSLAAGTTLPAVLNSQTNPAVNPATNRLRSDASAAYDYDASGNLTVSPGYTFIFDAENRIVSSNYAPPNQQATPNL